MAGLLTLTLAASPSAQQPAAAPPLERGPTLSGFAPARRAGQLDLERRFDGELKADNLRAWMRRIAARPHHLGSPYGKENAEFIAGLFRSWGYEVEITDYQVLFPTPTLRKLELVAPTKFVASLTEPPLKEDATSSQTAEALPPFNVYSADGDVTGRAGLRQLRRPGRLRGARAPRHRRARARSSSPATAARGAASSRRSPPSTARSAA